METKPKSKCSHEDNRLKVCAVCGKKIVYGNSPNSKFMISKDVESLIKQYSNNEFNVLDSRFPKGVCVSCRFALYSIRQEKTPRKVPNMPNYLSSEFSCSRDDQVCDCYICRVATQKGHPKPVRGRVKEDSRLNKPTLKICKICFAEISKGKPHSCNSNVAHKNVVATIESLPDKTQDRILHELLATKAKISDPSSNLKNVDMNVKTGGREDVNLFFRRKIR